MGASRTEQVAVESHREAEVPVVILVPFAVSCTLEKSLKLPMG